MLIFFDSSKIFYIKILFGTKSCYTTLLNYVMIFKVDAQMPEILVDFSKEESQKNSTH